ncbi:MAG: hypothetical protein JO097_00115 [Acidobacteriaceae bacterium]|nr:hypothetical protein [Acidobacteriaceae bacterium]MBV9300881.1 hypothetical protein [Acidobacteriaceae bacterium]
MAERIGLSSPSDVPSGLQSPIVGAPTIAIQPEQVSKNSAPIFSAPVLQPNTSGLPPEPNTSIEHPPSGEPCEQVQPEQSAGALELTAPNSGAPNFDEPGFTEPEFDLRDLLIRHTRTKSYIVHPVSRIEDVFTSAERDLLKWLWERGRSVPTTQRIRLVTGANGEGARRLATQAGLIYNTFKNLTRALSTKFALGIVKPERNLPTIYAVYHYSSILERQRLAGFTGAVNKNGGGRELVNTKAQPAPRRPDLTVDELEKIIGTHKSGAPKSGSRAPNFAAVSGNFGAPKIAALIRNKEYTSGKENTTTTASAPNVGAPTIVVDSLFQRTGRTDIDAARLITKGCQEANASIQPDEIARLIRTAQIPPNITNAVGLLIRALPSRCAAESIPNYREQWRKEDEQERRRHEQDRTQTIETARNILDSVVKGEQWDNDTIEWAKSVLATIKHQV